MMMLFDRIPVSGGQNRPEKFKSLIRGKRKSQIVKRACADGTDKATGRRAGKQADRQTERQRDKQIDRQESRQAGRQT